MKITFAIETANKKINLIQHDTKQINRRVGKLKVHARKFHHEAEWQRRWEQDRELQERYAGRFYDGEDMSSSPVNPYDIPRLIGILVSEKSGLVDWLEGEDLEDELVTDPDRPARKYTRKKVHA